MWQLKILMESNKKPVKKERPVEKVEREEVKEEESELRLVNL